MSSTIPDALAAIARIANTALPALQIGDAGVLETENDFLIVGYENDDAPAVQGARAPADAAMASNTETYDVSNLLSVWIGDADTAAARTRLFAYLDTLDAALFAQPRLAETDGVMLARVTDFELQQSLAGEGVGTTATLRFTIHVDAWRTP